MSQEDFFDLKKVTAWLNTEEGKQALDEIARCTEEALAKIRRLRQIDERSLYTPIGPADGSGLWPHQKRG